MRICILCDMQNSEHNISSICDRCSANIEPVTYMCISELVASGKIRQARALYRKWRDCKW